MRAGIGLYGKTETVEPLLSSGWSRGFVYLGKLPVEVSASLDSKDPHNCTVSSVRFISSRVSTPDPYNPNTIPSAAYNVHTLTLETAKNQRTSLSPCIKRDSLSRQFKIPSLSAAPTLALHARKCRISSTCVRGLTAVTCVCSV